MILAKIRVNGIRTTPYEVRDIPMGIIGGQVLFEYTDPMWDGLTKTVVFQGTVTKDVVDAGELVTIPQEVVAKAIPNLRVGVYGTGDDKKIAIPTLWADLGRVRAAADPSGDESTDPQLPVWAQLQEQIKELKENCIGGGLTAEQITALDGMFKVCAYDDSKDVSGAYAAFKTAFGITDSGDNGGDTGEDSGDSGETETATYTVSSELVNVTSSNSTTSVNEGASYSTTLAASDGYALDSAAVTVTMGGTDITSTAYADGVISIASVTGNVEIIACAVKVEEVKAELVTDGLIGFWDFRNCDYSASTMKATVGDGTLVRFGATSSDEYGVVANTAFAYSPGTSASYTTFAAPMTIVGVGYGDAVSLWNYLIRGSNIGNVYASLAIDWYNTAGDKGALSGLNIADTDDAYKHLTITLDVNNVVNYYLNGIHVATLDPVELGLENFDNWNVSTTYFGNLEKSNPATAVALYDRALTDVEALSMYEYTKTLEVA